jgi:hypothetical protein
MRHGHRDNFHGTGQMNFGELIDIDLRNAWQDEAREFTPWLANNLDRIGEATGLALQLQAVEVGVGRFSADILARNTTDESLVLIENQLERTDHTHLGQVMTYLAGLGASTVIWIASEFQEPHLSAVEWLNENTVDYFRFFAVTVRAVRIGESPIAPVFDIQARPNDWSRQLRSIGGSSGSRAKWVQLYSEFWQFFLDRHPDERHFGEPTKTLYRFNLLDDVDFIVAMLFNSEGAGVYIRGRRGVPDSETTARLRPNFDRLVELTGGRVVNTDTDPYVSSFRRFDVWNRDGWSDIADWLKETADRYRLALRQLYGEND